MATRLSARRWRTAWNWAMGWSNWIRSTAWSRASCEHRPRRADQLVGEARAGRRPRRRASRRASARPTTSPSARHLDQAERAGRCRRPAGASAAPVSTTMRVRSPATTSARSRPRERRRCRGPAPSDAPSASRPGGVDGPERGQHHRRRRRRAARRGRRRAPTSSADDVRGRRALELEQRGDRGLGVHARASLPAQLGERGVERRRRSWSSVACWRPVGEQLALGGVHHRSVPRSRRRRAMMLRWISALPP